MSCNFKETPVFMMGAWYFSTDYVRELMQEKAALLAKLHETQQRLEITQRVARKLHDSAIEDNDVAALKERLEGLLLDYKHLANINSNLKEEVRNLNASRNQKSDLLRKIHELTQKEE